MVQVGETLTQISGHIRRWLRGFSFQQSIFTLLQIFIAAWAFYLWRHLPGPGWAVAILAGVAAAMSVHGEMRGWQKAIWMGLIGALLIVELLALRKDREDSNARYLADRQKQELAFKGIRETQDLDFKATVEGLKDSISQGEAHFNATMAGLNENLKVTTGGDSVCYLELDDPRNISSKEPYNFPMIFLLKKKGIYPLYNVEIQALGPISSGPRTMGGLPFNMMGAQLFRIAELPAGDRKEFYGDKLAFNYKYNPSGVDIYVAFRARNGIWHQILLLRPITEAGDMLRWVVATRVYHLEFEKAQVGRLEPPHVKRQLIFESIEKGFPIPSENIKWNVNFLAP